MSDIIGIIAGMREIVQKITDKPIPNEILLEIYYSEEFKKALCKAVKDQIKMMKMDVDHMKMMKMGATSPALWL